MILAEDALCADILVLEAFNVQPYWLNDISIIENRHIAADIEILDIMSEEVLCTSNETLEENEGIW